jgi:hypothetical protein
MSNLSDLSPTGEPYFPGIERATDYDSYEVNLKSIFDFWWALYWRGDYGNPATETEVLKIIHTLYTEQLAIQRGRLRQLNQKP